MVELKLPGGVSAVSGVERKKIIIKNKINKCNTKSNIRCNNVTNSQNHNKRNYRVNFRLIQRGGYVNDETNRVIPAGTLTCQQDVLFTPERDC